MAYKPMWNFGGVRISGTNGGFPISFDTDEAMGEIEFDEVVSGSFITNSGRIYKKSLGFRPKIRMKIVNIKDGTADKISTLFSYLNVIMTSSYALASGRNEPIGIYPRFNDDYAASENLKYDCYLDSSVSAPDIAKLNIGQIIVLDFIGADVVNLPTESLPVYDDWEILTSSGVDKLEFNIGGSSEIARLKIL